MYMGGGGGGGVQGQKQLNPVITYELWIQETPKGAIFSQVHRLYKTAVEISVCIDLLPLPLTSISVYMRSVFYSTWNCLMPGFRGRACGGKGGSWQGTKGHHFLAAHCPLPSASSPTISIETVFATLTSRDCLCSTHIQRLSLQHSHPAVSPPTSKPNWISNSVTTNI